MIASAVGNVEDLVATSDGARVVVAWRETRPNGSLVRVVRVQADGREVDATPLDVVTIPYAATFSVAAEASSILVAYTEPQVSGATAVRAVIVPN